MSRTFSNFKQPLYALRTLIFVYYVFGFNAIRAEFILDNWEKTMTSGIAFGRPDRLRAFPYDRFKIYMIVPIELDSIQAIEVV